MCTQIATETSNQDGQHYLQICAEFKKHKYKSHIHVQCVSLYQCGHLVHSSHRPNAWPLNVVTKINLMKNHYLYHERIYSRYNNAHTCTTYVPIWSTHNMLIVAIGAQKHNSLSICDFMHGL